MGGGRILLERGPLRFRALMLAPGICTPRRTVTPRSRYRGGIQRHLNCHHRHCDWLVTLKGRF